MSKLSIQKLALYGITCLTVLSGIAQAADDRSGPGITRFGVDASEWSSSTLPAPGIVPIGGAGQLNGNFVTAERNGVQIGVRAVERFAAAPLPFSQDGKTGVYVAETGVSDGLGRATWNYDLHVDLRGATGVAKGKTLADYDLFLVTDYAATVFGFPVPLDIGAFATFANAGNPNVVLFQTSLNPVFGSTGFNPLVPGQFNFSLVLTPRTFNGPSLVADMDVVVVNP